MGNIRLGLVGASGTGKTALAVKLSSALSIPCLMAKDVTGAILTRDGYDYSSGEQVERFLAHMGRQNEMLRKTMEQQSGEQFVADRTVLDLAAYVMAEIHGEQNSGAVHSMFETCKVNVSRYTHIFMCPWREGPIAANNRRTLDPWYQRMIHMIEVGLLVEWGCHYTVLKAKTEEARCEEVLGVLRKRGDIPELP